MSVISAEEMKLLLCVSQGQVVFDAQGSRMAMTLIEQLQGKTPGQDLPRSICCLHNPSVCLFIYWLITAHVLVSFKPFLEMVSYLSVVT